MEIVFGIILFLLSIWLLISTFIVAYWFFLPAEWFWKKHKYITGAIFIGAFFCCGLVIGSGVRFLFWFIPEDWTYKTEDGEIRPIVISISSFIGLIGAIFLCVLFDKVDEMRHSIEELETKLNVIGKIKQRKEDLDLENDN